MAREPIKREVLFRARDLPGFLDMLRYDSCTVVSWDHDHLRDTYAVTLRGDNARLPEYQFTDARWQSFGIGISAPIRR
jgi:hypothetical protein